MPPYGNNFVKGKGFVIGKIPCVIWCALCEKVSYDISKQQRPSSACTSMQSDLNILFIGRYYNIHWALVAHLDGRPDWRPGGRWLDPRQGRNHSFVAIDHELASVAQLDAPPTGDQEVAGSTPAEVGNILSWRLICEIFSAVILSLPLIQEGQLSVSGERMYTILVNGLED